MRRGHQGHAARTGAAWIIPCSRALNLKALFLIMTCTRSGRRQPMNSAAISKARRHAASMDSININLHVLSLACPYYNDCLASNMPNITLYACVARHLARATRTSG